MKSEGYDQERTETKMSRDIKKRMMLDQRIPCAPSEKQEDIERWISVKVPEG